MSIALGGYTLLSTITHQLPIEGEWVNEVMRYAVYGVRGTLQITDERHGRQITVAARFISYASRMALKAALETVDAKVPALADGTLTIDCGGSDILTYSHVTLDMMARNGPAQYDAKSGGNQWQQDVTFVFWQSDNVA